MPFYYFLPGKTLQAFNAGADAFLRDNHLAHLAGETDPRWITTEMAGNKPGLLIVPQPVNQAAPPDVVTIDATRQTWAVRAGGALELGWITGTPPTPEQLARKSYIGGVGLPDEHNRLWYVPVVTSKTSTTRITLPVNYSFDDNGHPVAKSKPQHQTLADIADRCWEYWTSDNGQPFSDDELIDCAVALLSHNYRIGKHEIAAFEVMGCPLLDTIRISAITRWAVDYDKYLEAQKKSD